MDSYIFFACASVLVACTRYGIYFHSIYQGKTKPHAFSWFLWSLVTGIGAAAQFDLGAGPSAWALGFVSASCLLISVLALFIGERHYARSDWFALVACFVAIALWRVTDNAMLALAIVILIDFLTYWPTIRKSFHKPDSEPPISYGFAGLRYFLMLFAIPDPSWQTLIYPLFLALVDWVFAGFLVVRRAQMGLPLHEYARRKG